jgi:hypothetical protein
MECALSRANVTMDGMDAIRAKSSGFNIPGLTRQSGQTTVKMPIASSGQVLAGGLH